MSDQEQEGFEFDDRSIKEPYEQAKELEEELPSASPNERLQWTLRTRLSQREELRLLREMKDAQNRRDEAIAKGDRESAKHAEAITDGCYKRLMDNYWGMVGNIVKRRISNETSQQLVRVQGGKYEPDDICIIAFKRVWESIEKMPAVPDDYKFGGVLNVTTVNLCIDALRRLRKAEPVEVVSLDKTSEDEEGHKMTQADLVKDPAPKPDELAERREWRDTLRQAMERLPERQRAVVEMREIEGLTYPEIAKQLGVSERTAKSDYAKAMETLRTRLQAQDAPDQNPGGEAQ